ncbi:hypothetical protein Vadar_009000 [Vaccinium darrowii]|uniref:Uncharacterized protein n=1 Tax=Vaccinium darrowii TaxID=229202 RepID=A0ACB7XPD3_9ERIC|nr:hypothetical protein Vadar_009000 [Vaccinium darrowii]
MAEASRPHQLILNFSAPTHKPPPILVSFTQPPLTTHDAPPLVRCSISTARIAATNWTIPWVCEVDSLKNAEALQKGLPDSGEVLQTSRISIAEPKL